LTVQSVATLKAWLQDRQGEPSDPLFPTSRGRALSADAVELLVSKYPAVAEDCCSTLRAKIVTPHVLRHSTAMSLLHAGVDPTVIALSLRHESVQSTQMYVHADLSLKERPGSCSPAPHATNLATLSLRSWRPCDYPELWGGLAPCELAPASDSG